tara:strand:+ start:479 stop:625 length:147 start_codon:yes stop_codon:yes gene_type:complete
MSKFKLNRNQIKFFHTFGFILLERLFIEEIDNLIKSFDEVWQKVNKKK